MSSNTTIVRGDSAGSDHTSQRTVNIVTWVLQIVLAAIFAGAGVAKLAGDQAMVDLFADIGIGQWFRYVVGVLEIAGAVGLLIPRICGLAAAGLVALMLGAVITTIALLDDSVLAPLGVLVLCAVVAYLRWLRTRALLARVGL